MKTDRRANQDQVSRDLKDYQILQKIGEGSFGQVFKVRDTKTGETVAMKQIGMSECNPGELIDKLNEANVMKNIRHPYIN